MAFVRLIAIFCAVACIICSPCYAATKVKAPPGFVLLTAKNTSDFINLGKSGRNAVWCRYKHTKGGVLQVGFVSRDKRLKKKLWKNFDQNIRDAKKSRLSVRARKKQVSKYQALKSEFLSRCEAALATPVPTSTPTTPPTATATATLAATVTATATATATVTATATATATSTPTATPTSFPPAVPSLVLWDAGASSNPPFYVDSEGRTWLPDNEGVIESTAVFRQIPPQPIQGPLGYDTLYLTERHAPLMQYRFPVVSGPYDIVLHFAEIFPAINGPGQRLFDVKIEGQNAFNEVVDVYDEAGGGNIAYTPPPHQVTVTDGLLNIEFIGAFGSVTPDAKISAIEIRPAGGVREDNIYTVNCGADGDDFADPNIPGLVWEDDTQFVDGATRIFATSSPISGTLDDPLHQTERFAGVLNYAYGSQTDPIPNRSYGVTLGFAEIFSGITGPGQRVMDIALEGNTLLSGLDIFAEVGPYAALEKTLQASVEDGILNIQLRGVVQNAKVSFIKIDALNLNVAPSYQDFGLQAPGTESAPATIRLRNDGSSTITVSGIEKGGPNASEFLLSGASQYVLGPGAQAEVEVVFAPQSSGAKLASLSIQTDDASVLNGLYTVSLTGVADEVAFAEETLADQNTVGMNLLKRPTSLMFGPDGKLYIAQQNGRIHILTLNPDKTFSSAVRVDTIYNRQTLNANGTPARWWPPAGGTEPDPDQPPGELVQGRQVTGIYVGENAGQIEIYVVHSDPRIGRGDGLEVEIDTAGGILTRLTGPSFSVSEDLVVGLPRSRENHAVNSLQLRDGWLYMAAGSNTNWGGESSAFGNFPEVRLTATLARVNLNALGNTPIDVREGSTPESNLPFEQPGIFEVYASGYRNVYDMLWHSNDKLYVNVNAPNEFSVGPLPDPSDCPQTANFVYPQDRVLDSLFIVDQNDYGGHPNPSRGQCVYDDGTLYDPPVSPEPAYRSPIHLYQNSISTNGIAEYISLSAFAGAMFGDLITVSTFDPNQIRRIRLSADGQSVLSDTVLADQANWGPLDVTVDSDGNIFAAGFFANVIKLFRPLLPGPPGDYDNDGIPDVVDEDDDNDLYTDIDEIANGKNPKNPSSRPSDFDQSINGQGFKDSDLFDFDDDDDGELDSVDRFIFDPSNGADTVLPIAFEWNPGDPSLGKIRDTGFTGFVLQADAGGLIGTNVSQGGAGGFLVISATGGTFLGAQDSQDNALQIGINASPQGPTGVFTVATRLTDPFLFMPLGPEGAEAGGLLWALDRDNYLSLTLSGDSNGSDPGGPDGIQLSLETLGGNPVVLASAPVSLPGPNSVDLFLTINPDLERVTAWYRVDSSLEQDIIELGTFDTNGLPDLSPLFASEVGIGVFATRANEPSSTFSGLFDYFRVSHGPARQPGSASTASADIVIDPGSGTIEDASTYTTSSFKITNTATGGQRITRVRFDLRSAILPDLVFDPLGTAGDTVAKPFTRDSGEIATGFSGAFLGGPHDLGFDVLDVVFDGAAAFDSGEQFTFSIDVDPTSIRGQPFVGAAGPGSVSGLELSGAKVTVSFNDGTSFTRDLFATSGSDIASRVSARSSNPPVPTLQVIGVPSTPATVSSALQVIRLTGTSSAAVRLLRLEGALDLTDVPGGGFDLDPFEMNMALVREEYSATVEPDGDVDIDVILSQQGANSGFNYFIAVIDDGVSTGFVSDAVVLRYQP